MYFYTLQLVHDAIPKNNIINCILTDILKFCSQILRKNIWYGIVCNAQNSMFAECEKSAPN